MVFPSIPLERDLSSKEFFLQELQGFAGVGSVRTPPQSTVHTAFTKSALAVTRAIQVTYRNIEVSVDGKVIATEQEPLIFEGRTYLAVKDVAEVFDAEVKMNESTNTVEITSRKTPQPPDSQEQKQVSPDKKQK